MTTALVSPDDLPPKALAFLQRRGIDPATARTDEQAPDVVTMRLENLGAAISDRIGDRFAFAETNNPDATAWSRAFLAEPSTAGNLLLLGPTGVGKTHLAAAVIRRVASSRARDIRSPLHWTAASHPQFNAEMRPSNDGRHLAVLERCQTTGLLFLDDLAAGLASEWTADTLYRLADARWSHHRPTIVASNLPPIELRAAIGERVWERITDEATVIALKGESRRGRKVAQS